MWFVGELRAALSQLEGGVGRLAATAHAGGIARPCSYLLASGHRYQPRSSSSIAATCKRHFPWAASALENPKTLSKTPPLCRDALSIRCTMLGIQVSSLPGSRILDISVRRFARTWLVPLRRECSRTRVSSSRLEFPLRRGSVIAVANGCAPASALGKVKRVRWEQFPTRVKRLQFFLTSRLHLREYLRSE